jgi:hypothetical protein
MGRVLTSRARSAIWATRSGLSIHRRCPRVGDIERLEEAFGVQVVAVGGEPGPRFASDRSTLLRSSPAVGGRCWTSGPPVRPAAQSTPYARRRPRSRDYSPVGPASLENDRVCHCLAVR